MTTFRTEKVNCAACRAENEQHIMTSTSKFGSPDLDFRPPMVERDALWLKASACSECGFASRDLSVSRAGDAECVRTEVYQRILKPQGKVTLHGVFAAAAFLADRAGSVAEAGWFHVFAAWASDDLETMSDAKTAREAAIDCFGRARARNQRFCNDEAAESLLLIDLNRRAGHFFDAQWKCHDFLQGDISAGARELAEFEAVLIVSKDDACHSMSECQQKENRHES